MHAHLNETPVEMSTRGTVQFHRFLVTTDLAENLRLPFHPFTRHQATLTGSFRRFNLE
jgi:hypothetical protein